MTQNPADVINIAADLTADSPWVDIVDACADALNDDGYDADGRVERLAQRVDAYLAKQSDKGAPTMILTTSFDRWDGDDSLWTVTTQDGTKYSVAAHNGYGATQAVAATLGRCVEGSGKAVLPDRKTYLYVTREVPS